MPTIDAGDLPQPERQISGTAAVLIPAALRDKKVVYRDVWELELDFGEVLVDVTRNTFREYFTRVEIIFDETKFATAHDDFDYLFEIQSDAHVRIGVASGGLFPEDSVDVFTTVDALKNKVRLAEPRRFKGQERVLAFSPEKKAMARSALYGAYGDIMPRLVAFLEGR